MARARAHGVVVQVAEEGEEEATRLWVDDGTGVLPVRWRRSRRRPRPGQQEQEGQEETGEVVAPAGAAGRLLLGRFVEVVGRVVRLPSPPPPRGTAAAPPQQDQQPEDEQQQEPWERGLEAEAIFIPGDADAETAALLATLRLYGDRYLRPPPLPLPSPPPPQASAPAPKPYVPNPVQPPPPPQQRQHQRQHQHQQRPTTAAAATAAAAAAAAVAARQQAGIVNDEAVLRCVAGGAGRGGVGMGELLGQLSVELSLDGTASAAWAALAAGVNASVSRLQVEGLVYVKQGKFFPL